MLHCTRIALAALLAVSLLGSAVQGDLSESLKQGTPEIKSIGPITFGPDGVLFVGDAQGAAIFAIDSGDRTAASPAPIKVEKIDEKVAALLGTDAKQILINDLAVNPVSGKVYLSVSRGKGPASQSAILRLDAKGKIEEVALKDVKFAKTNIPNASDKSRQEAITGLAYVKGKLYVAGLSNEQFASTLRAIPFPFAAGDKGTSVEIYHGAHGKFETHAPVRTFVPYDINGQAHLLAAYTCTPLVKIPVADLKPGEKVKGTTVAELGNGNRPLDMIVYQKGGKDYLLLANNKRGVMKIATEGIDKIEGITSPVKGGAKAGLTYETIKEWQGVQQLDKLDKDNAVVLIRTESGALNLETLPLP